MNISKEIVRITKQIFGKKITKIEISDKSLIFDVDNFISIGFVFFETSIQFMLKDGLKWIVPPCTFIENSQLESKFLSLYRFQNYTEIKKLYTVSDVVIRNFNERHIVD